MKVNESNRTNNDEVIKEFHHRIAELDGMLAEETRQLKEMTAQMEKTSLKKAIDLIMAQPPELHYPSYYADLLRKADVPDRNDGDTMRQAVKHLDLFTKIYCRDKSVTDDLAFRCEECEFEMHDRKCLVKCMAYKLCPDYREFGSMGDL